VIHRLKSSLLPTAKPSTTNLETGGGPPELYGPVMLVFTLVAILLLGMKLSPSMSAHPTAMQEGTLMGTAFGLCFTYWFVGSLLYRFIAYLCSMELTVMGALSITGYGLFGYCLALVCHYLLFALAPILSLAALLVFGGAASAKLGLTFYHDIQFKNWTQAAVAGGTIFAIHFLFLAYLRAYYASLGALIA